jgi:hypothetical protein
MTKKRAYAIIKLILNLNGDFMLYRRVEYHHGFVDIVGRAKYMVASFYARIGHGNFRCKNGVSRGVYGDPVNACNRADLRAAQNPCAYDGFRDINATLYNLALRCVGAGYQFENAQLKVHE